MLPLRYMLPSQILPAEANLNEHIAFYVMTTFAHKQFLVRARQSLQSRDMILIYPNFRTQEVSNIQE